MSEVKLSYRYFHCLAVGNYYVDSGRYAERGCVAVGRDALSAYVVDVYRSSSVDADFAVTCHDAHLFAIDSINIALCLCQLECACVDVESYGVGSREGSSAAFEVFCECAAKGVFRSVCLKAPRAASEVLVDAPEAECSRFCIGSGFHCHYAFEYAFLFGLR